MVQIKTIIMILAVMLTSCIEIDHTGEVDVNHKITLDEIDVILTVDTASEISGEVAVKAEDIAKLMGEGQ